MGKFLQNKIKQLRCHHRWVQTDYKMLTHYNDHIYDAEGNRVGYIPKTWKRIYECVLCGKHSSKRFNNSK